MPKAPPWWCHSSTHRVPRGGLCRHLAGLRTRGEPTSRSRPNGGPAVQPCGPAEVERCRGSAHPGDGLLSRDEFVALLGLVAAKAGHTYTHEHLAAMFTEADLDCNDVLDLNELLLLLRGDAVRLPGGAG